MKKIVFCLLAAFAARADIPPPPVLGVASILRNGVATNDITHTSATFAWQAVASATDGYQFHAATSPVPETGPLFHTGPNTSISQLNGWTAVGANNITGAPQAINLPSGAHLTSPLLDLSSLAGARLSFGCRFYGSSRQVRVRASADPGDWTAAVVVGTYTPPNNTLNPVEMNLSAFCGRKIYLRFDVPSAAATQGAGVANIRVYEMIYDTLPQCDNRPVAADATSVTIGGLSPKSDYFIRARSMGSDGVAGNWSAFLPFTTLPGPKGTVFIIK